MSKIRYSRKTLFGHRKYGDSIGDLYGLGQGEGLSTYVLFFALAGACLGGWIAHDHMMWLGTEPIGKTLRIIGTLAAAVVSAGVSIPASFIALFAIGLGFVGLVFWGLGAMLWHFL